MRGTDAIHRSLKLTGVRVRLDREPDRKNPPQRTLIDLGLCLIPSHLRLGTVMSTRFVKKITPTVTC